MPSVSLKILILILVFGQNNKAKKVKDFDVIKVFSYRHEADHAKSLLEAEGIASMVSADDAGGMRPDLAFGMGGVKLLVQKKNSEESQEILKAFYGEELW